MVGPDGFRAAGTSPFPPPVGFEIISSYYSSLLP
jgi:hypothetical protein